MQLPEGFSFHQQNLEDYVNCRRLFYLRHIVKQEWPALESEPVREHEELMRLGEGFHRMVYQQGVGIPEEVILSSISDPILETWWQQFSKLAIASLPGIRHYEKLVSVPFDKYRLLAKYDLLIFTPEKGAVIYDWKTSQREPQRKWLQKRLQTRVYPLVLSLKQEQPLIEPQAIEMTYWYPAFPEMAIGFNYGREQYDSDREYLLGLIREIESLEENQFDLTRQTRLCAFCRYRSLCERGEKAGDWREREESEPVPDSDFDIDFGELPTLA